MVHLYTKVEEEPSPGLHKEHYPKGRVNFNQIGSDPFPNINSFMQKEIITTSEINSPPKETQHFGEAKPKWGQMAPTGADLTNSLSRLNQIYPILSQKFDA